MGNFKGEGAEEHTLAGVPCGCIQLSATTLREDWVLSIQMQVVDGLIHLHTNASHTSEDCHSVNPSDMSSYLK